jgi:hypothetical protein
LSYFSGLFGPVRKKSLLIFRHSQQHVFPQTDSVRATAYKLAKEMRISNHFNDETETEGYDWLNSIFRRNPELSVRQAEGLSEAVAQGMGRKNVKTFLI